MDDAASSLVEPVHWDARLVRADDVHYTEVGGTPLLVCHTNGELQALTPAWAAIWGQLDGRPIADALEVDPALLDPIDARNLIEVLRRMKANRVVRDADPSIAPRDHSDLDREPSTGKPMSISVRGSMWRRDRSATLRVDPEAPDQVTVRLAEEPTGVVVSFRHRFRRRRADRIEVHDSSTSSEPRGAHDYFATIIAALDDYSVLATPGLVDLLAGVAERASAPKSPDP